MGSSTNSAPHAAQLATARWGFSAALTGGRSATALAQLLQTLAAQHRGATDDNDRRMK